VVNPSGVTEPTVGWKRAPLSVVAPTSEVISDKCFTYCILKFIDCIYIYVYAHRTVKL
jgi:hypothetical protein